MTLTFSEITLKPLKTATGTTTGTSGNVHVTTAAANDPIAGLELSGNATADTALGNFAIATTGEFELTSATQRCTWKIAAS